MMNPKNKLQKDSLVARQEIADQLEKMQTSGVIKPSESPGQAQLFWLEKMELLGSALIIEP